MEEVRRLGLPKTEQSVSWHGFTGRLLLGKDITMLRDGQLVSPLYNTKASLGNTNCLL